MLIGGSNWWNVATDTAGGEKSGVDDYGNFITTLTLTYLCSIALEGLNLAFRLGEYDGIS